MREEKKSASWKALAVGVLIALVLVVCLQNSQEVGVEVLTANFSAPLIVVLAVAVGIGVVIGYAFPVLRSHRHEERARTGRDQGKS